MGSSSLASAERPHYSNKLDSQLPTPEPAAEEPDPEVPTDPEQPSTPTGTIELLPSDFTALTYGVGGQGVWSSVE